ncbi:hypothetical protein [Empedobacter brevis]|uniref:hypothetical protein n=1 Tax=Empedobacter brevis TaxID=247 RepID=UPI0028D5DCEA|nr:hypothetical protein [Empedobacter brevis]
MKDLNKFNTALDLSKLAAWEIKSLINLIANADERIYFETYKNLYVGKFDILFKNLVFNEDTDQYTESSDDNYVIVSFQTFKQIHFNAKTS